MAAPLTALRTIRDVERELTRLRRETMGPDEATTLRTSSMTHVAWVPPRWVDAATDTLAGLAERHPARTVLLFPEPEAGRDALVADVDLRCFLGNGVPRQVCSEVIEIRLLGARAQAPASVVQPLLLPDLPVFLRWRGPLGTSDGERALVGVVDRLVVDTEEWPELEAALPGLAASFDHAVVSDIAWARIRPWREAVAALWPGIAEPSEVHVAGPEADAVLLAAWLGSRLGRHVELRHEPAGEIELVEVDGRRADPPRPDGRSASDLLSEQLDVFGRDRVYEEAVLEAAARRPGESRRRSPRLRAGESRRFLRDS